MWSERYDAMFVVHARLDRLHCVRRVRGVVVRGVPPIADAAVARHGAERHRRRLVA